MKRLVSLLLVILCISSLYSVEFEHKTVLDIFGDSIKDKALTLSEPLDGKYTDAYNEQEPIIWVMRIDERGYISFDIFKDGKPFDLSSFYYLT